MIEKVRAHLVTQGYHVVDEDPDDKTRAAASEDRQARGRRGRHERVSHRPAAPISKQLADALTRTFGEPPVRIRTSGGTVPIAPFIDALGVPAISVPIVNFDNNQHGENENLRLGHFFRGITTMAAVLRM